MSKHRFESYKAKWKKETVKLKYDKVIVTNYTIGR